MLGTYTESKAPSAGSTADSQRQSDFLLRKNVTAWKQQNQGHAYISHLKVVKLRAFPLKFKKQTKKIL
jgi:hypothetical protein